MDTYYSRPEVSNSDLSALQKYLYPRGDNFDPTEAYKFGTLIDCMITEPEKVNFLKYTCDGEQYTREQFEQAKQMKRAFMGDDRCRMMYESATGQAVMSKEKQFENGNVTFSLPVRCKWDLWMPSFGWGGDIKSTTATTQKQFEEAVRHFDYDRQRAWYMNIAGSAQDVLIGISKVNFQVFKVPIRRGDELFKSGTEKYLELAFRWWILFC